MNKSYRSYLLRIWQSDERDQPIWVASLEDPHTRRIVHFTSFEELWHFLMERVAVPDSTQSLSKSSEENEQ
ncbi:MAG: hypothetical protein ROW48_10335 [Bellilinea sp.]